ncbi:MAG: hypothetical protein Q8K75_09335 [Chlamydiales bacterium]|nr:hypothetical protein [Chlamydiales bacterium]
MDAIVLRSKTSDGTPLEASFAPVGLELLSFKRGDIEVLDTSQNSFIIGPHFDQRNPGIIPNLPQGQTDPYPFGIAHFVPWEVQNDEMRLKATLSGKQLLDEQPLATLEGQQFTMTMIARLTAKGLGIGLSVVSDSDSITGLDCSFRLPNGSGILSSDVREQYLEGKETKSIPSTWHYDDGRRLHLDLSQPANATFHPFVNPLEANILLVTPQYRLTQKYSCQCQENSWQVIKDPQSNNVRIRMLSAKLPHRPSLTVSSLNIHLEISPT